MTHKSIRLAPDAYADTHTVFSITTCTKGRRPVFADHAAARVTTNVLERHAAKTGVRLFAWCVMPDHVHLVIAPSATCDVVTFVGQFKNLAQRDCWRLGVVGAFWQPRFWDHALRSNEDLSCVIRYVLDNPVRRGIVGVYSDYPHSGVAVGIRVGLVGLSVRKAA